MSEQDYQKLDSEADAEINSLYGLELSNNDELQPEPSKEPEIESVTQDEVVDSQDAVDNSQTIETPQTIEQSEPTIPESRYKDAVRAMNKAQQDAAQLRKDNSAKDDYIQQLDQYIKSQKATSEDNNRKPDKATTDNKDDDLTEAKELYPEVINPMMRMIDELKSQLADVRGEMGNVKTVTEKYQQSEQQTAADKHWADIRASHNDVDEIAKSPEYSDWYYNQSELIQKALASGTSRDVVSALNLFRMEHPKAVTEAQPAKQTNKPDKLAEAKAAAGPNVKSSGAKPETKTTFTPDEIGKMSIKEFEKYESEIEDAMGRGDIR